MSSASTGGGTTEGSSPSTSPASAMATAPKYGTLVPNRIFVGGISASTSEAELAQVFSAYGNVKATKIIADRAGVSKGYGFVTFETEEEAKRLQQDPECIILRERKLNIAPAIKKQPFNRTFDGNSCSGSSVPTTSTYYFTNGMGLTYPNGAMTFYNPPPGTPLTHHHPPSADPAAIYQTGGVFAGAAAAAAQGGPNQSFGPLVYSCPTPSIYVPQQYQYSPVPYEPYYPGGPSVGGMQSLPGTMSVNGGGNNGPTTTTNTNSPTTGSTGGNSLLQSPFYPHHQQSTPGQLHHHHHPPPPPPHPHLMENLYYSFTPTPSIQIPQHPSMNLTTDQPQQQLFMYSADNSSETTQQENNEAEDNPGGGLMTTPTIYNDKPTTTSYNYGIARRKRFNNQTQFPPPASSSTSSASINQYFNFTMRSNFNNTNNNNHHHHHQVQWYGNNAPQNSQRCLYTKTMNVVVGTHHPHTGNYQNKFNQSKSTFKEDGSTCGGGGDASRMSNNNNNQDKTMISDTCRQMKTLSL